MTVVFPKSTEVTCICPSPYGYNRDCVIHANHDSLHCANGDNCCRIHTNIGEWIGSDDEGVYPRSESAYVFEFPERPGLYFCEDCEAEISAGDRPLPPVNIDATEADWIKSAGVENPDMSEAEEAAAAERWTAKVDDLMTNRKDTE